jgi:hypothetical protein
MYQMLIQVLNDQAKEAERYVNRGKRR